MNKLADRRRANMLIASACLVYFASYLTRINFAAIIVEFIASEGVAKSAASVITSVIFFTYGAGQLISGYLGDRILPQRLIFVGLLVAAAANILLPMASPSIPVMAVIWGINGMAQAFMWPPLVKILKTALSDADYDRGIPLVTVSSASATILIYLAAPLVIGLSHWKTVFVLTSSAGVVAAILWLFLSRKLLADVAFDLRTGRSSARKKTDTAPAGTGILWKLLPVILISISIQGMLRDGISTWMPNFMSETFDLGSSLSILTGVALPIFHILINLLTYRILRRMHNDCFATIVLLFGTMTLLLGVQAVCGSRWMFLSLILIALTNGLVHGVNLLQTCYIPAQFGGAGNISFLAGMLNAATYVGSALSTYVFAVISENSGWNSTILSWILFSAGGMALTAICLAAQRRDRRKSAS